MPATHFAVTVETSRPSRTDVAEAWLDTLTPWGAAVSAGRAGTLVVDMTVPADTVAQAVATACAVVGGLSDVVAVEALPDDLREARAGWVKVPALLSVTQAASRLGVSRQRVLQMIHEGKVPAERVGRDWAIPATVVASR